MLRSREILFIFAVFWSGESESFDLLGWSSATVQYSSLDDVVNFRFRINYISRTGDDIFFIYNEGGNVDELESGLLGRSIMLKWTYSFDF